MPDLQKVKKLVWALGDIVAELEDELGLEEDDMDIDEDDMDQDDLDSGAAAVSSLKGQCGSTTRSYQMSHTRD